MPFVTYSQLPVRELFGGTIKGRYAHLERSTLGEIYLDADTVVPMHEHVHEQITFVIEGRFEFTVDGETRVLEAGDAALIPSHAVHGGRTLTACRVVDVFSPARDDYR